MASRDLVVRLIGDTSKFAASLKGASNDVTRFGGKMTRTFTPIAAGVAAGMTMIGSSWNDARNAIVSGTGATGEALSRLMGDVRAVAGQVPISFGDAGRAVAELNTRLGLTGTELQDAAVQVANFSRVFNLDITAASADVGRLMNALDIGPDGLNGLLDKLTFAAQESGINVQSLMGYIIDAGPAFEELGFGLDETIALFSQFEAAGARPQEVLGSLNIAMTRMARDGATDAAEAFDMIIRSIADAPNIMEATRIAADAFGDRVGGKIAEDIRAGRFEVDGFVEAMQHVDGRLDATASEMLTLSDRLQILRNRLIGALGPFGEIGGAASGFVAALGPMIFGLGQMIPLLGKLRGAMIALGKVITGHPLLLMATVIGGVVAGFALFNDGAAASRERVEELARSIRDAGDAATGLRNQLIMFADDNSDIVQAMAAAGLTLEDFAAAVEGGEDAVFEFGVAVRDAGREAGIFSDSDAMKLQGRLRHLAGEFERSIELAEDVEFVYGELGGAASGLGDDLDDLGSTANRLEGDIGDLTRAHQQHAEGMRRASEDAARVAEISAASQEAAAGVIRDEYERLERKADDLRQRTASAFQGATSEVNRFSTEAQSDIGAFRSELQTNAADLTRWQDDLIAVVAATSPEFGEYLAQMGLAGSELVSQLAEGGDDLEATFNDWVALSEATKRDMAEEFGGVNEEYSKVLQGLNGLTQLELIDLQIAASQEALKVGQALSQGMGDGVTAAAPAIASAIEQAIDDALAAAKRKGIIESPSKLFRDEVGVPIVDGVEQGIVDEAWRVSESLEAAIEQARDDAIRAAADMVREVQDEVSEVWRGIDDRRRLEDLQDSVAAAEKKLAEAVAAAAEAARDYGEGSDEHAAALGRVESAQDALERANLRLLKAMADAFEQGEMTEEQFRDLAEAAGLERGEIDGLVASYERLAEARAKAAREERAANQRADNDQLTRTAFQAAVADGRITAGELNHLAHFGADDPELALSLMRSYLQAAAGRQLGGQVGPRDRYRVGEHDRPELLKIGADQYLIPGDRGGVVVPISPAGGQGSSMTVNMTVHTNADPNAVVQALESWVRRNGVPRALR